MIDDIFVRLQLVQEVLINSFSNADYSERKLIFIPRNAFEKLPPRRLPARVIVEVANGPRKGEFGR